MDWSDLLNYPKPDGTTGQVQARVAITDVWAQTFLGSGNAARPGALALVQHQTRDAALALGPPVARTDTQAARLDEIEAKVDQILAILTGPQ